MKRKHWVVLCGVVLVLCLATGAVASGCQRSIAGTYCAYTYDTTVNRFVDLQTTFSINKEHSQYEIVYGNLIHLIGTVSPTVTGYRLSTDLAVLAQLQAEVARLTEDEDELSDESTQAVQRSFVAEEQIFFYNDYLFSSSSIDLVRRVSAGEKKLTYTAVDGYYESANNTDCVYLFKNGLVYGTESEYDEKTKVTTYKKDEDGEPILSQTANASYTMANGLLVLTRINGKGEAIKDEQGNPDRIVYLMAAITYPNDLDAFVYTDDDYSDAIKAMAEQLKGKSVGVLTKTFYATHDMTAASFN